MQKLSLLILLFLAVNVKAQIPDITVSRPVPGGPINITYYNPATLNADDYFYEADQNERKGDLKVALALYDKAASGFSMSRRMPQYCLTLLKLSNVHMLMNNFSKAEKLVLEGALMNYSKLGSISGEMDAYQQLAKIYLAADKLTESLWFSTQQGILAQRLSNQNAYISSLLGLAQVKIKRQEFSLANYDLNRAETLARSNNYSDFTGQIRDARKAIADGQNIKK
jgi:tetratricopeptide (TPR) repeat protein